MLKLDHILWGSPDLDRGELEFGELTGVVAATGGTHPGFGTRNKLASLGHGVFFEIIAPDPAQPAHNSTGRAGAIAAMPTPALLTFAVQTTDIDAATAAAQAAGLTIAQRHAMQRTRPDGVTLKWTVAHFEHQEYGNLIPFAIDWQGSPHPSTTSPSGCTLRRFTALHPQPEGLRHIYATLGLDMAVLGAVKPGLLAELDTPQGAVCLLAL